MTFLGQLSYLVAVFLIVQHVGCPHRPSMLDRSRNAIWEFLRSEKVKRFLEDLGKPTERR